MPGETSSADVLIELDHVRVQFGTLVAVRDVSLSLRAGDLVGLIGPNGAGKTTLLRAAAGLQPLNAGCVRVMDDAVLPGAIQVKRHIGFTPDNPGVYEQLTVRDFLRFVAKGYDLGYREVDERIDFWLEQVWLSEKKNQKIKSLSRGMRQRIGIARTMLPNPNVVLLDEPAAGLDPAGRAQFRRLLSNLRDQGKALMVSSHILADLNEYCTHIAIMAHGSIVQFGTVAEVANGGDGQRCRYTIELAQRVPNVADCVVGIPEMEGMLVDGDRITVEFSSQKQDAARLLAELIRRGMPVASFSANRPDLEEAYLRTGIRQVD